MPLPNFAVQSPQLSPEDPFDAGIAQVGFVMSRDKPPIWSLTDHANPHFDILAFCIGGRALYECENDEFEVTRGMMLFFRRGTIHSAKTDPADPWSFASVGFSLKFPDEHTESLYTRLPVKQRMPNWPQIVDQYKDLVRYWNHRPAGFALACRGITAQLVQQYVATAVQQSLSVPHTVRLEKIIKMMHENVGRVHSVHELAHLAELSDSRFRLLFHQLTGFSVTRYQNRLRIHAARDLLLSGHYSVTQVAMELGFRDVYYFSRLFKKIAGFNPSECLSR